METLKGNPISDSDVLYCLRLTIPKDFISAEKLILFLTLKKPILITNWVETQEQEISIMLMNSHTKRFTQVNGQVVLSLEVQTIIEGQFLDGIAIFQYGKGYKEIEGEVEFNIVLQGEQVETNDQL